VPPTASREQYHAALFAEEIAAEQREARLCRRACQVIVAMLALLLTGFCPPALALLALLLLMRRYGHG
jgi:hypothetical protein